MQQPVSCNTGKWVEKSQAHKDKDGPVKAACLSCRTKKAKCDGGRPVCGQVSNCINDLGAGPDRTVHCTATTILSNAEGSEQQAS